MESCSTLINFFFILLVSKISPGLGALKFCSPDNTTTYSYNNSKTVNEFSILSPDYPKDYKNTEAYWNGGNCVIRVAKIPKIMIDILYYSPVLESDSTACEDVPYSILNNSSQDLKVDGVAGCIRSLDGQRYHRWRSFLNEAVIIRLSLPRGSGKAFTINVTMTTWTNITKMANVAAPTPASQAEGYVMSHPAFSFDPSRDPPSIPDNNYTHSVRFTSSSTMIWLYLDLIDINNATPGTCTSELIIKDYEGKVIYNTCGQNRATPQTIIHLDNSSPKDFVFNHQGVTGFLFFYKFVTCDPPEYSGDSDHTENGTGNEFDVKCASGYKLSLSQTSYTCGLNGEWQGETPRCIMEATTSHRTTTIASTTTLPTVSSSSRPQTPNTDLPNSKLTTSPTTETITSTSTKLPMTRTDTDGEMHSKLKRFFAQADNIIIVAVSCGGLILIIIIIIIAVKLANVKRNNSTKSDDSTSNDEENYHYVGQEMTERPATIARAEEIRPPPRPAPVHTTQQNHEVNGSTSTFRVSDDCDDQRYSNVETILRREREGTIEDMYAPIQKQKRNPPQPPVDMMDNDLYGSTDE